MASIDLLLIGLDTDTDAVRVHVPDGGGWIDIDAYVDAMEVYQATRQLAGEDPDRAIADWVGARLAGDGIEPVPGMLELVARLLRNNISQIDYVRSHHQGAYADAGHQERFIGVGLGFEEVQLRNLTYFAYLRTVEQGARDLDVGMKIFTRLNVERGLPVPVIIRSDYHGRVPGARERAHAHCRCLEAALKTRYADRVAAGALHTLLVVRDLGGGGGIEVVGGSLTGTGPAGAGGEP